MRLIWLCVGGELNSPVCGVLGLLHFSVCAFSSIVMMVLLAYCYGVDRFLPCLFFFHCSCISFSLCLSYFYGQICSTRCWKFAMRNIIVPQCRSDEMH